jgi:hypothetical protein
MFSCTFFDGEKQWFVCYNPGFIQINCHGGVNVELNFPPGEQVGYEQRSNYRSGGQNAWADLKTQGFTLRACTRTYKDRNDSKFDPAKDRTGDPSGDVEIEFHATEYSGGHYMTFQVPYLLAKGLMKLMYGKYDLEGAVQVNKT